MVALVFGVCPTIENAAMEGRKQEKNTEGAPSVIGSCIKMLPSQFGTAEKVKFSPVFVL